jgi:hypothetical protein
MFDKELIAHAVMICESWKRERRLLECDYPERELAVKLSYQKEGLPVDAEKLSWEMSELGIPPLSRVVGGSPTPTRPNSLTAPKPDVSS